MAGLTLALGFGCVDPGVVGTVCPGGLACDTATGQDAGRIPLDAASSPFDAASTQAGAGRCAGDPPVDMYLLIDDSTSMLPWWPATLEGINDFFHAPESEELGVGLQFFGTSCDIAVYVDPRVPIAPLPGNLLVLQTAFPLIPSEESAMRPALTGAITHARSWAVSHPDHQVMVVLMTDGAPEECDSTLDNVARVAMEGFQGQPPIPTHVIVLGALGILSVFAEAGGTGAARFVSPGAPAELHAALGELRDAKRPCSAARP